jgi:hypothetical protein
LPTPPTPSSTPFSKALPIAAYPRPFPDFPTLKQIAPILAAGGLSGSVFRRSADGQGAARRRAGTFFSNRVSAGVCWLDSRRSVRRRQWGSLEIAGGRGFGGYGRFSVWLRQRSGAQGEKMVRVSEDGQSAHTIFRVLNRFSDGLLHQVGLSDLTFVEATLKTGRTHQIRVHLQSQDRGRWCGRIGRLR